MRADRSGDRSFSVATPTGAGHLRGIAFMLAAIAILPAMDAIAKLLTERYSVLQISWARFFFAFLVLVPFAREHIGTTLIRPPRLALQLARSVCQVVAVFLFFSTLSYLPLADTLAICFLYPLLTVALAAMLLGESVGLRRWLAVMVGFVGAMIIIRPGLGVFQPASLLGLLTSLVFAGFIILTRVLASTAPAAVLLLWGTLVGTVVLSALVPFVWITPGATDLALMLGMGAIGAAGHLLLLKAYESAPLAVLSPIGYAEIIGAVLFGWIIFGELPDGATWLGIVVICAAGIYIALGAPRPRPLANR